MKLNYRKFGKGNPLIILHGLYGGGDNWYTIGKKLQNNYTIYLVDQRNHGSSPHNSEMNYTVLAADLREFILEHKLTSAAIMGHSMGGKVAMKFAFQYPQLVDKLVVIDIALRDYAPSGVYAEQALMHQMIIQSLSQLDLSLGTRGAIDTELRKTINGGAIRQFLLKNLKRKDDGVGFYWQINLSALSSNLENIMHNVADEGASFDKPVLIINGAKSGYINQEDKTQFQKVFSDCTIVDLNTGHWVHAEEPEKLIQELHNFLCC